MDVSAPSEIWQWLRGWSISKNVHQICNATKNYKHNSQKVPKMKYSNWVNEIRVNILADVSYPLPAPILCNLQRYI